MKVNKYCYVTQHGKFPRGEANWKFQPGDGAGHIYRDIKPVCIKNSTYSQACKSIKKHWSAYSDIYVLP